MTNIKGNSLFIGFFCLFFSSQAQNKVTQIIYKDASAFYISGKLLPTDKIYQRVDTASFPELPKVVKRLLTQSAGLAICFMSNSPAIYAKWCVQNPPFYPNLTAIASRGLDLYIEKEGRWQFAGVGKPDKDCSLSTIVENINPGENKFLLYLPVYSELGQLEIGVKKGSTLQSSSPPIPPKRVLVYGSSITQGAAASRSGLAYPAVLSRRTGYDFINAGLSGSAKMEPEVVDMLNEIEADAYVLDCIPNSSEQNIKERALNMVLKIHERHPGKPIVLLNSIQREQGFIDNRVGRMLDDQNTSIDSVAKILLAKKIKDFYFIDTKGFLGADHEGTTDGVHPNDLGSFRFVEKLEPLLTAILDKYF